jgi:hypothetical protein
MNQTNTRRLEVDGELYDVPVETYSRAFIEAELTVWRRQLEQDLAAAGDPAADARLEEVGRPLGYSLDLIRAHAAEVLAAWDAHEDRQRTRLRLPPRQDS